MVKLSSFQIGAVIFFSVLILFFWMGLSYPDTILMNDEWFLLKDISKNNFILDFDEFWKDKDGQRWGVYKLLFSLYGNLPFWSVITRFSGVLSVGIFAVIFVNVFREYLSQSSIYFLVIVTCALNIPFWPEISHHLIAMRNFERIIVFSIGVASFYGLVGFKDLLRGSAWVLLASVISIIFGGAFLMAITLSIGVVWAAYAVFMMVSFRQASAKAWLAFGISFLPLASFVIYIQGFIGKVNVWQAFNPIDIVLFVGAYVGTPVFILLQKITDVHEFIVIIAFLGIGVCCFALSRLRVLFSSINGLVILFGFMIVVLAAGFIYLGESHKANWGLNIAYTRRFIAGSQFSFFIWVWLIVYLFERFKVYIDRSLPFKIVGLSMAIIFSVSSVWFGFDAAEKRFLSRFKNSQKFERRVESFLTGNEDIGCYRLISHWKDFGEDKCRAIVVDYAKWRAGEVDIRLKIF